MLVTMQTALLFVLVAKSERELTCSSDSQTYSCESGNLESSQESTNNDYTSEEEKAPRNHLPSCTNCISGLAKTYLAEREGFVSVNCGKCSIYQLDVRAWKDTRCDPNVCWGLTLDLFYGSKNCMWKKNCILPYTPSLIMWSPPDQQSCIGKDPRIVDVDFSCLDSGTAIDDVMKDYQTVEKERGRVLSHHDSGSNDLTNTALNRYVMDITPPASMRESRKNYFVIFYVLAAKFTTEDTLTLGDPSSLDSNKVLKESYDTTTWEKGDVHIVNCSTLRFDFRVNNPSHIHSNFDLCFQWFVQYDKKAKKLFNKTIEHCKRAKGKKKPKIEKLYIIKMITTNHTTGIIRSHVRHPWNYPRPILSKTDHTSNKSRRHIHVLQAPVGLPYLTVEASQIDLGCGDDLSIASNTQKGEQLKKTGPYYISGERVTLNFTIVHSTSYTNSGFVLCYEWSESRDMIGSKSPCKKFIYRINHCGKGGPGNKCHLPGTKRSTESSNGGSTTVPRGNKTSVTQRTTNAPGNKGNTTRSTGQRRNAVPRKTSKQPEHIKTDRKHRDRQNP